MWLRVSGCARMSTVGLGENWWQVRTELLNARIVNGERGAGRVNPVVDSIFEWYLAQVLLRAAVVLMFQFNDLHINCKF